MRARAIVIGALAALVATGAIAQDVTFDDLKGMTVEGTSVQARKVRTIRGEAQQRANHLFRAVIGKDGKIQHVHTITLETLSGPARSGSMSYGGNFVLEKPQKYRDGTAVFLFAEGSLVRLRTLNTGGQRWTLTFARDGGKLTCKSDSGFAQEQGQGAVRSTSSLSGNPVLILSAKEVGSSCRVRTN